MFKLVNLVVHYGKGEALKGISVDAEEGTIVSLIGANGAGKSTCLRAISGLVPITSGEIWFDGIRIEGMAPDKIARLGIAHVPEGKRLFYRMSVFKNLMSGAFTRRDPAEIARNLEQTYQHFPVLKRKRTQSARALSGGEQQMLACGRGLLANPRLILFDEPSMGLAPILVKELGEHIKRLAETGVIIILVEQNASLALKLSRKAYLLEAGRVVLEGDAKELREMELVKKSYVGL